MRAMVMKTCERDIWEAFVFEEYWTEKSPRLLLFFALYVQGLSSLCFLVLLSSRGTVASLPLLLLLTDWAMVLGDGEGSQLFC